MREHEELERSPIYTDWTEQKYKTPWWKFWSLSSGSIGGGIMGVLLGLLVGGFVLLKSAFEWHEIATMVSLLLVAVVAGGILVLGGAMLVGGLLCCVDAIRKAVRRCHPKSQMN